MNESQLVRAIKAHLERGDKAAEKSVQHYIAAGQHLKTLKANHGGTWAEWEDLLKTKIGIGKSRASELMQIADGRKTVEQVRDNGAERKAEHDARKKISPLRNGENAADGPAAGNGSDPQASADKRREEYAALDDEEVRPEVAAELDKKGSCFVDDDGNPVPDEGVEDPEVAAALQVVGRMSEDSRESFFEKLEESYPNDDEFTFHRGESELDIVRTLVEAIGAEETRALGKKMSGLVFKAIGRAALPDCQWCKGSGVGEFNFHGLVGRHQCHCTRRRRGEDFDALRARLERKNAEKGIPEQDFSFGLEAKTKDGRVWSCAVRLPTEEQAGFYFDYWARHDLRKHGYQTWEDEPGYDLLGFDVKRYDEQPTAKIWGGKRKNLSFLHGTCGTLGPGGWQPISGGECDCKKCKDRRAFWEKYKEDVADDGDLEAAAA